MSSNEEISIVFTSYLLIILIASGVFLSLLYQRDREIVVGIVVNLLLWIVYNVFAFVMCIWCIICMIYNYVFVKQSQ